MRGSSLHSCRSGGSGEAVREAASPIEGSVAILTMWSILFLALLSLSLSKEVAGRFLVAADMKWGPKVRALGSKALADSVRLISQDKSVEHDSLQDPWARNDKLFQKVPYEGGSYSLIERIPSSEGEESESHYGLTDEERKINLNRVPAAALSKLLQIKGRLSATVADDLANSIIDWRDENATQEENPATAEDCSYFHPPARCKNSNFEALEELFWIPGITVTLFEQIKNDLTLYGGGTCNINTATIACFRAAGLSEAGAAKIIAWRSAGNVFENISWITGRSGEVGLADEDQAKLQTAASSGFFSIRSDFYHGLVQTEFGGRVRGHVSFIVNRKGEVQSWRE